MRQQIIIKILVTCLFLSLEVFGQGIDQPIFKIDRPLRPWVIEESEINLGSGEGLSPSSFGYVEEFGKEVPPGTELRILETRNLPNGVFHRVQMKSSGLDEWTDLDSWFPSDAIGYSAETSSYACHGCKSAGFGALCEINELAQYMPGIYSTMGNVRTPRQVDGYIQCMLEHAEEDNSEYFQRRIDYLQKYRHQIKQASQSFGVPAQLIQCILIKETKLDPDVEADESTGTGLCQMLSPTAKQVGKDLRKGEKALSKEASYREEISSKSVSKALVAERKVYLGFIQLYKDWSNYVNSETFRSDSMDLDVSPSPKNPTEFDFNRGDSDSRFRPEVCIGLTAYYLKSNLLKMTRRSIRSTQFSDVASSFEAESDENSALNMMLLMGAAYKEGGGGDVGRLIRNTKPQTLSAIVKAIEAHDSGPNSVSVYIRSLRRCLSQGDYDPPVGMFESNDWPACTKYKAEEQTSISSDSADENVGARGFGARRNRPVNASQHLQNWMSDADDI